MLRLDEIGRGDLGRVGAKAANLGELRRAGFEVPDGFVVTTDADLDAAAPEIRDAYGSLGVDTGGSVGEPAVAVRSSTVEEDGPVRSWAGIHDSYLDVVGAESVIARVAECRASLHSPRVDAYDDRSHDPGPGGRTAGPVRDSMAVVVQIMAPVDRTGVAFTADPRVATGAAVVVVEAARGAAGSVVDGSAEPDSYAVDPTGPVILSEHRGGRPGAAAASTAVLSGREVLSVAALGMRVQALFGAPQDVEWTMDADGSIWVVQARPITTGHPLGDGVVFDGRVEGHGAGGPGNPGDEPGEVVVEGVGASPGVATGRVRVLSSPLDGPDLCDGEVLVAPATSPGWIAVMRRAVAVVTDSGGMASHAAIVARELGVPCVVGAGTATMDLHDGEVVTVDGSSGAVHRR